MLTIILFCLLPLFNSQMDTVKDKWSLYNATIYPKIAKLLVRLKIFKTQQQADFWFNSTGESWRNAYIDGTKDSSKPNSNKVQWSILGLFKINKPAMYVDAWHYLKGLLIFTLCVLVAINLPILFLTSHPILARAIYTVLLSFVWGTIFESFYKRQ